MRHPELPPPAASPGVLLAGLKTRVRRPHEASVCFHEPAFGRAAVKVLPGEFFVHDKDLVITTTLGSCVAACLHDPATGLAGMNHFMLPEGSDATGGARFGLYAMELLVNELLRRGARRTGLQARLFGGGQVVQGLAATQIGEKNVAFARNFLAQEGIPLRGGDVLDVHPRRVCMLPRLGTVLCRRLPLDGRRALVAQEDRYRAELGRHRGGEIELF
ncbi:chemoreceptor glutamine deamidase CheD [Ramlibacter alkalitolerans]|uniref:Probable chemoreceptor glutamine deamidase CheD n=1 Tax=Ramlibacter alkalitolerans TaxID=2039631 RepID=A0ABS1JL81_9BURK|nr:chemoreceptor glutamine deamidase CheD [Ramlibacter alkalitolerans]MBL0424896.1 chemoreceptor glutamine deamidase CheD [Ramlibacter alkalitolerans]